MFIFNSSLYKSNSLKIYHRSKRNAKENRESSQSNKKENIDKVEENKDIVELENFSAHDFKNKTSSLQSDKPRNDQNADIDIDDGDVDVHPNFLSNPNELGGIDNMSNSHKSIQQLPDDDLLLINDDQYKSQHQELAEGYDSSNNQKWHHYVGFESLEKSEENKSQKQYSPKNKEELQYVHQKNISDDAIEEFKGNFSDQRQHESIINLNQSQNLPKFIILLT